MIRVVFLIIFLVGLLSGQNFEVKLRLDPKDATVDFIGNEDITYSPNMIIDEGEYPIYVYKKGYIPKSLILDVTHDIKWKLISLEKESYKVKKDNSEEIDKKENLIKEPTPIVKIKTSIRKKYKPKKYKPKKFKLRIGTSPRDAKVILIDKHNRKILYRWEMKLPQGKYRVKVSRRGYITKEGSVTVPYSKSNSFRLKHKKSVAKKRVKNKINVFHTLRIRPVHNARNVNAKIKILNPKKRYKNNVLLKGGIRYKISVYRRGCKKRIIYTTLRSNEDFEVALHGNCR